MTAPRFAAYSAYALRLTQAPPGAIATPRQTTSRHRRLGRWLLTSRQSDAAKAGFTPAIVVPAPSTAGHRRWAAWT
jgi:hypothetical protein